MKRSPSPQQNTENKKPKKEEQPLEAANVNVENTPNTLLMKALNAPEINLFSIKILLQYGLGSEAEFYALNQEGNNLAMLAASHGDIEILALLHGKGADLSKGNGARTPLMIAFNNRDMPTFNKLLELGAGTDAEKLSFRLAKMIANKEASGIKQCLQEAIIDPDILRQHGVDLATLAVSSSDPELLVLLHQAGINLNKINDTKCLFLPALINKDIPTIKQLLALNVAKQSDLCFFVNDRNLTALAIEADDIELLEALKKKYVDFRGNMSNMLTLVTPFDLYKRLNTKTSFLSKMKLVEYYGDDFLNHVGGLTEISGCLKLMYLERLPPKLLKGFITSLLQTTEGKHFATRLNWFSIFGGIHSNPLSSGKTFQETINLTEELGVTYDYKDLLEKYLSDYSFYITFQTVRFFIEKGADINRIKDNKTFLMSKESLEMSCNLLELDAKIDLRDNKKNTALHHYAFGRLPPFDLELIKILAYHHYRPHYTFVLSSPPTTLDPTKVYLYQNSKNDWVFCVQSYKKKAKPIHAKYWEELNTLKHIDHLPYNLKSEIIESIPINRFITGPFAALKNAKSKTAFSLLKSKKNFYRLILLDQLEQIRNDATYYLAHALMMQKPITDLVTKEKNRNKILNKFTKLKEGLSILFNPMLPIELKELIWDEVRESQKVSNHGRKYIPYYSQKSDRLTRQFSDSVGKRLFQLEPCKEQSFLTQYFDVTPPKETTHTPSRKKKSSA